MRSKKKEKNVVVVVVAHLREQPVGHRESGCA